MLPRAEPVPATAIVRWQAPRSGDSCHCQAVGRPKQQPGQVQTRDRILGAAEAAFATRGFHGASLETIAEQAGIRRPSLLYHYSSKQMLYSTVLERVFLGLQQALSEAMMVDVPFSERIRAITDRFDRYIAARPHAAQLVLRELLDNHGSGQEILLAGAAPLLDMVEAFVRASPDALVDGPPIREALMTIAASRFVRAAAGPSADPLWGAESHLPCLAHRLFVK